MRETASLLVLSLANGLLGYGIIRDDTNLILAGIGFAILYLAIKFRHFHEDVLCGSNKFQIDGKTDD